MTKPKNLGQYNINCKTAERRKFLQDQIRLALALTFAPDDNPYPVIVKGLQLLNESLLRQMQSKAYDK